MNSTFAPRDRRGEWILTFSGERFYPFSPAPEEVKTKDIAHALANICRFNGHTRGFYSVAAHSVHVSRLVPPEFALEALLHDAAEAYVGDMVRPLKRGLPAFEEVEERVRSAIAARYRIPRDLSECVREGRFVPLAELAAAIGYGMHGRPSIDEATANIVRQHVARLRRQLAPFGRESVVMRYRRGYALVREDVP